MEFIYPLKISRVKLFIFKLLKVINVFAGVYSSRATPDPIPNSEVKPTCGDGIAGVILWESSTMPALIL